MDIFPAVGMAFGLAVTWSFTNIPVILQVTCALASVTRIKLWVYILNYLIEFDNGNDVEFYFPDQPIKVTMKHIRNNALFKVGEVGVIIEKKVFMIFMANSCLKFFKDMMCIDGTPDYGSEIKLSLNFIERLNS